jgi:hypothetical protein
MVSGNDGIYISWEVFRDYATSGSLILKEMVRYALDLLLGEKKTLTTTLPAQGVTTLTRQKDRYIVHLLYAVPVRRGIKTEVIEDIQPLYQVEVQLNIKDKANKVYLAPQMEELEFSYEQEAVRVVVPKLENHQMIVFDICKEEIL